MPCECGSNRVHGGLCGHAASRGAAASAVLRGEALKSNDYDLHRPRLPLPLVFALISLSSYCSLDPAHTVCAAKTEMLSGICSCPRQCSAVLADGRVAPCCPLCRRDCPKTTPRGGTRPTPGATRWRLRSRCARKPGPAAMRPILWRCSSNARRSAEARRGGRSSALAP